MSIDTRDKRVSVLGVNSSAPRLEQNPSGTISVSGRQIAGLIYSGIQAAAGFNPSWVAFHTNVVIIPQPQPIPR